MWIKRNVRLGVKSFVCFAGDVEHTHLVKGLDYSLLNKVRSEMVKRPEAGDDADGKAR